MLRLLKESNINPVFVAISSETQVTGFYNIIETFQVYIHVHVHVCLYVLVYIVV